MSILLAESNPTRRRFARQLFEQHFPAYGPVREVADGASAVQVAPTERPELLVVDVDLPGVHGVEAARQIWAQTPDINIIFWAESADETCIRQTSRLIPPDTVYGYLTGLCPRSAVGRSMGSGCLPCLCHNHGGGGPPHLRRSAED